MIALYPLLVSNTISRNIVPGVCKILENHIIVYGLSGLLDRVRRSSGVSGDYSIKLNKIIKREDIEEHLPEFLYREIIEEQSGIFGVNRPGTKNIPKTQSDIDAAYDYNEKLKDTERMARAKERGKQSASNPGKDASVRLDTYGMESISLEPTWMKIDQFDRNGNKSTGLIGVKVVPYAVKSDATLSQLLMYDNQVGKLQRLAIIIGRQTLNSLYKIFIGSWKRLWSKIPIIGGDGQDPVTGDPRLDILLKRNMVAAGHAQDIFVLANHAELSDDFYASAKGMVNLQRMGWGSIIIADDVNRRVAFCMQELKGLCSLIPYTMLYQTLSQAKVYEDIEDAKRNASSIFKVARKPMAKIIGEGIAQAKVEAFGNQMLPMFDAEFISEMSYIDENLKGFIQTMNPMKLKTTLFDISKGKFDKIPTVANEKLVQYGMKLNPEFRKGQMLAKQVISNSTPEVSDKMAEIGATMTCVYAILMKPEGEFIPTVKEVLKKMIVSFRKFRAKGKADKVKMPAAHFMDAAFGWFIILFLLGLMVASFPFFQATWQAVYKFSKMSADYLEGFDAQTAMKAAQETAQNLQPQEYLASHAPALVLAFIGMALIWKFIKGESR